MAYVSKMDRLSAELAALPLAAFLARTADIFAGCMTVDRAQFERANAGAPPMPVFEGGEYLFDKAA